MELPKTMELPKNIVQIGKPDPTHKIFVEDYVISYMKQWNKHGKRDTGIVLFGKKMAEGDYRYYFVYGASYMPGVEARAQYLTEEEREEIEEVRAKHFAEYELLGWGELRGEMPEGFYMWEHNKGVWIRGYACFFEKNDSMLSFMVTEGSKDLESQMTVLHKDTQQNMYDRESNIDARMEERNRKLEQIRQNQVPTIDKVIHEMPVKEEQSKSWKNKAVLMALVVCAVAGLVFTDEDKRRNLEEAVGGVVAIATKEATKLKDKQVETLQAGVDNVSAEGTDEGVVPQEAAQNQDQLMGQGEMQSQEAVANEAGVQSQENEAIQSASQSQGEVVSQDGTAQVEGVVPSSSDNAEVQQAQNSSDAVTQTSQTTGTENKTDEGQEVVARYVSYTIQKGDTLLDICRRECGSESLLQQVCQLNNIDNPDEIKIGQIILLPE